MFIERTLLRRTMMRPHHEERFLNVAGLTHKSVLIAWGSFFFRIKESDGEFHLVDDEDLQQESRRRKGSIGASSLPYGNATVEVLDNGGRVVSSAITNAYNHAWVTGLEPDTEYSYRVTVGNKKWGAGQLLDWIQKDNRMGLFPGREYNNRFRTLPHPQAPAPGPVTFAIIGDFGTGIKKANRPQARIAELLEKAVDQFNVRFVLTTGDNIYAGKRLLGLPIGATGDEDDDWYFTFYQPYRYIINRIPFYPTLGNHDSRETEDEDDRAQVIDNFYIDERMKGEEAAGRTSRGPGLFYQFRYGSNIEFVCIDTSKDRGLFRGGRLFEEQSNRQYLESAFSPADGNSPGWRIPFCHHPPFSAGPHHNTKSMRQLLDLFLRAGVKAMFSGHSHNFQHNQHDGINYFVSGAAGKLSDDTPNKFEEAHTLSWSASNHFLLVTIEGNEMRIRAIGGFDNDQLSDIQRKDRGLNLVTDPIVLQLT
jgi:tartrate-resistant acid phosphatase type 5